MWRNIEIKRRSLYFFAIVALRGLYYGKLTEFFANFTSIPLITFFISGIWFIEWNWKLVFFIPILLLCQLSIGIIIQHYVQTFQIFQEMKNLFIKHDQRSFVPTTTAEYLDSLYENYPDKHKQDENIFLKKMIPESEYYQGTYIRLVVIEQEKTSSVAVLSSFVTSNAAWIFLNSQPSKMTRSQHFSTLHEMGHAHPFSSFTLKAGKYHLLAALPVIIFLLDTNYISAILLLLTLGIFFWTKQTSFNFFIRNSRFYQEIIADNYALWRCPKEWFEKWSEEDVEIIASSISKDKIDSSQHSNLMLDLPLTQEQENFRCKNLASNIRRIKNGEPIIYKDDDTDPHEKNRLRLRLFQSFLLFVMLIALGSQISEITFFKLVVMFLITFVLVVIGLTIDMLAKVGVKYWDIKCGLEVELSKIDYKNLDSLLRFLYRQDFQKYQFKLLEKIEQIKDKYIEESFIPPNIDGTLLEPKVIALYSDKTTFESFIILEKTIDNNISHLEYYSQNHSILFVMNDGRRLILGVKVGWLLRPYFLRANEIKILRIENDVEKQIAIVPFQIMS